MILRPLLLLPVLAWSLSQAPEPADAARKTADQAKPAEDSPDAARVTPELVEQLTTELRQKIEAQLADKVLGLPRVAAEQEDAANVGDPPSTGDEREKTTPEAPGALNFGAIEYVSKPGPEQSPPFKVGIVQANGNLVPLATFDGRHWSRIDLAEDWRNGRRVQSKGEWTLWYESSDPGSPQLFPARSLRRRTFSKGSRARGQCRRSVAGSAWEPLRR